MCEGWTGVSRCTCLYMSFWIFTAYSWIVLLLSRTERPPEKPPCPLPSAALRAASTCTDYGSFWISTTNTWIVTHKKLSNTSVWIRVCVLSWTSIHIWYHDIILEIKTWHMVCQFICVYIIYIIDYFYTNQYTIILYTFVCVCMWARWYTHIYIAPTQYCYIKCWYKDAHGLSKISLPDVNLLCCCNRRQHSEAPSLVEVMNCIQRSPRSEYFGSWPVLTVPRDGARAVCTTQCKATPRTGLPSMQCLCRVNCQPSKTQQRQSFDICSPFPQGKPWIKNWARTVSEWILCVYCVSMSISLCVCMYVIIRNYM